MFLSAIKKSFFDLWDHLFFALAVNLAFTLLTLGLASLSFMVVGIGPIGLLALPVPFLVSAVLGGLATFWARDIAVKGSAHFADVLAHLKSSWKASLAFGAAWMVIAVGLATGTKFYSELNPILGFVFGIIMVWAAFFGAGMSLYYPGLNAQIEPKIGKLVRKSFLVFLANPGTSLLVALVSLGAIVLTIVTLGFFPGIVGISLWLQVTFKFLMLKYEWMEANPEEDHKSVPWSVILAEDMEKVGPRSLKSLIFPWKD